MGYNEKDLLNKMEKEKNETVLPSKKETVGDILKKRREEAGKSIEYISNYLRIKSQYLKALEENNFNNLPGQAYVIGFIKSYASFLELDAKNIIEQYKLENTTVNSENIAIVVDENSLIEDPIINSNHAIFIGAAILMGIFVAYMFSGKDKATTPKISNEVQSLNSNMKTPTNNQALENFDIVLTAPQQIPYFHSEEVIGTMQTPSIITPMIEETTPVIQQEILPIIQQIDYIKIQENQESQENSPVYVFEDIELSPNTYSYSPESVNMNIGISTPQTIQIIEEEPIIIYEPKEYGLINKSDSRIELRVKDRVWVKLKKDGFYRYDAELGDIGTGDSVFETILQAGDIYYVPYEDDQYLTIGNAQAIDIIVDGEVIKPLSTRPLSRHNIEMDVDKLEDGTAYIRNREIE